MLFLDHDDAPRASEEFRKLSLLPRRADAAVYAGACSRIAGDMRMADSLLTAAARRMGAPRESIAEWADRLVGIKPAATFSP